MFNRLAGLRQRAEVLDMLQHVADAQHDMFLWPHLRNKILDDLENAIKEGENAKDDDPDWEQSERPEEAGG